MAWPDWIDAIAERYLADEGNVFLLTGDLDATWPVDGDALGTVDVLVRFLSRTRQVVGVVRPDQPLELPNIGDVGRFRRLVGAYEVLTGARLRRDVTAAEDVLALVHAALAGTGCDQGYVVVDAHRILPGHRKRVEPLAAGAPPLWEWAGALHASNDIVLLLAPTVDSVRAELAASAVHVAVQAPIVELEPEPLDDDVAPPPVRAPTPSPPPARSAAPAEPPTDAPPGPSLDELGAALVAALQVTVPRHPVATWGSGLPVMDAVARVLADYDDRVGVLELSVDDEGRPVAAGVGADRFLERWRGDIALDAAAGMLLRELPVPEGAERFDGPVVPHETAVRALAKRLARLLAR